MKKIISKVFFRKRNINVSNPDREQRFQNSINSLSLLNFFIHHSSGRLVDEIREYFGNQYLRGCGIEIGAQAHPLKVDTCKAKVLYVDRINSEENCALHGSVTQLNKFVHVDILAEADSLKTIQSKSIDFVISNHVIEHLPDPIAALNEWFRVLDDKGVLFLTLPNRRANEYDFERQVVTVDHIIDDFENKTKEKKEEHWREFIAIVEGVSEGTAEYEETLEANYRAIDNRIHMHVFDKNLCESVLSYVKNKFYPEMNLIDAFYSDYASELILVIGKNVSSNNFGFCGVGYQHPKDSFKLHTNQIRNLFLLVSKTLSVKPMCAFQKIRMYCFPSVPASTT